MRPGSISDGEILLRLAIVVVLCGAIGLERQAREQIAGLRTHVIVGLGSGLFTLVSAYGFTAATPVLALAALVALRRLKPVVRRRLGSEALSLELELAPGASIRSLLGDLR